MTSRDVIGPRPFAPYDLPGMYRVCLLTGAAGRDATPTHRNPDLLGHLYAGPYPIADPGLTFVLADEGGVFGYVVATADTRRFVRWAEERWWPGLRRQYPAEMAIDPGDGSEDWRRVKALHEPEAYLDAVLERHPAHLHIDILPRAQGRGLGRALIEALTAELRARAVPGVHLTVAATNTGAQGFYRRMGFEEFKAVEGALVMALDLTR